MKGPMLAALLAAALTGAACADPAPAPKGSAPAVQAPAPLKAEPAPLAPQPIPAPSPQATPARPVPPPTTDERRFGHFPYAEGTNLQNNVCRHNDPERRFLHPDAAAALARMRDAALAATPKVDLNPASCFRSIDSQRALFNCSGNSGAGCAKGRLASPERRATAVAPPGFSEHATGYAVDFFPSGEDLKDTSACPTRNACTVAPAFARSRSGRWLAAHAHEYGFEQSFFPGSAQGVMVEPWHYRFVGTPEADEVFRAARLQFFPPRPGQR